MTKKITKRLNPGEIAIIDHADLDRVSAEELIRRKVAAVVNASVSITGRYPNLGPQLLLEAGIPVVDEAGPDVLVKVTDGAVVRLDQETLYLGDTVIAKGAPLTRESVQAAMTKARAMVAVQIESFAENTLEFLRREHELLTDGVRIPEMQTDMAGGMSSSWSAAITTMRISRRCGLTSGSANRCWWPWTAARTR